MNKSLITLIIWAAIALVAMFAVRIAGDVVDPLWTTADEISREAALNPANFVGRVEYQPSQQLVLTELATVRQLGQQNAEAIAALRVEFSAYRAEFRGLTQTVSGLAIDVTSLKSDVNERLAKLKAFAEGSREKAAARDGLVSALQAELAKLHEAQAKCGCQTPVAAEATQVVEAALVRTKSARYKTCAAWVAAGTAYWHVPPAYERVGKKLVLDGRCSRTRAYKRRSVKPPALPRRAAVTTRRPASVHSNGRPEWCKDAWVVHQNACVSDLAGQYGGGVSAPAAPAPSGHGGTPNGTGGGTAAPSGHGGTPNGTGGGTAAPSGHGAPPA